MAKACPSTFRPEDSAWPLIPCNRTLRSAPERSGRDVSSSKTQPHIKKERRRC